MSEPLAEHLSRFTPDVACLNRDALLFAAGRASARPNRRWQALVAALALSQVLTLVILRPQTPLPAPTPTPIVVETPAPAVPPDEFVPASVPTGILRAGMRSLDLDRVEPIYDEATVPSPPPLRAFGPPPASILN